MDRAVNRVAIPCFGRIERGRGHQKPQVWPHLAHHEDQPAQGHNLAHANAVHPNEWPVGAVGAWETELFTPARRVFFATFEPAFEDDRRNGFDHPRRNHQKTQGKRWLTHCP